MEATGHLRWFERLLAELNFELWIGESGADSGQAGAQTKERPQGCRAHSAADAGKSLSPHLGADARKSRCTTTGVAPGSPGRHADTSDESASGHRHERRRTAQARAMEQEGTGAAGVVAPTGLDQSAPARTARAAGPLGSELEQLSQAIEIPDIKMIIENSEDNNNTGEYWVLVRPGATSKRRAEIGYNNLPPFWSVLEQREARASFVSS